VGTELLIELDRADRMPLRRQLEVTLRTAIEGGRLPDGTRLPSSRSLAEQLGVSRGVVVDAYEQLIAQGFLMSHARTAPVVRSVAAPAPRSPQPAPANQFKLSPTTPDVRLFPRRAWQLATAAAMRDVPDAELGDPADRRGATELRRILAAYLYRVRHVRVELDNLILTAGFLHSVDLLCGVLVERGIRRIAVENPSVPDLGLIAGRHGMELDPIEVDHEGIVVETLRRTGAAAVIVTPAHQFPLGMVLSSRRRHELADWAADRDGLIIENDYDAEYRYDGPPIGAVQGLAPQHTVYVGTTSKTLAPAVRLGWVAAPDEIARALVATQLPGTGGSTGLNAHVFAQLLLSGSYERHVQRCRREYRRRRDALVRALAAQLPQLTVQGIAGGLHFTVGIPRGYDADRVAEAARSEGIEIRPLSYYTHGPAEHQGLVIGYGRLGPTSVPTVVSGLARALDL
jgi:GntR family transcriptional regulator/MocR family aminotransferase